MRVPVTGLLGRPGERRELVVDVAPEEFGSDPWGPTFEELVGAVSLALTLEAVSEGVVVRGTVRATPRASCARCLTPVHLEQVSEVTELHRAVTAPGARRAARRDERRDGRGDEHLAFDADDEEVVEDLDYELVDGDTALDLDQMVRDAVVVGQPVRVLCRTDCAGLCPTCGADRNTEPCEHGEERAIDPRWEALRSLRLPDASGPQGSG
jgi:uncharacterized protein